MSYEYENNPPNIYYAKNYAKTLWENSDVVY